ncbi:alpha/beta fold hydrolase [Deinococcus apachensis]|uniref:alpha/beta fold hydrolase n=1 Tax=Deinococcus apachensis TaxID=309886 RepID=UPI00146E0DF0
MQISVNGASLHLLERGNGPPLLLLSGGGGCPNYLAPVAELLPGFRCLLPDPRGTGRSTGGVYGLRTALDDLEAIREALGLLAHSGLLVGRGPRVGVHIDPRRADDPAGELGRNRHPKRPQLARRL